MKRIIAIIGIILCGLSFSVFAQQSGGDDTRNTCEISGGTWTGSAGGNWACCWADWGCYGCVDGNCKIKCHNTRCRKANGQATVSTGSGNGSKYQPIEGLAPAGMKSPIVPKPKVKAVAPDATPKAVQ